MLLIFVAWIYYTLMFLLTGSLCVRLFSLLIRPNNNDFRIPIFYYPWLGISLGVFLASGFSLFYRVNIEYHLLVQFLLLIYTIADRKNLRVLGSRILNAVSNFHPITWLGMLFFTLLILFYSSDGPVYNLDPGRYHFQNLLWAKTYPVVPGLANLHDRYGHSSGWYLLHAFADILLMDNKSYHFFNGMIFWYVILYGLYAVQKLIKGEASVHTVYLVMIFLFLCYHMNMIYCWYLSCITPDLAVNLYTIICVLILIEYSRFRKNLQQSLTEYFFYTFLATQAFSIRISAAYLLLPAVFLACRLYILYNKKIPVQMLLYSILLPVLLVVPVLTRNIILSGWILFPMPYFDFFSVDWKLPYDIIFMEFKSIRAVIFNKPQFDAEAANKIIYHSSHLKLLLLWLKDELLHFGFIYAVIVPITLLTAGYVFCKGKKIRMGIRIYLIPLLVSLGLFTAWFLTSPLLRYGFSYTAIVFALFCAPLIFLFNTNNIVIRYCLSVILSAAIGILVFRFILHTIPVSFISNPFLYPVNVINYLFTQQKWTSIVGLPNPKYKTVYLKSGGYVNIPEYDTTYISFGRNQAYVTPYFGISYPDSIPISILFNDYRLTNDAFVAKMSWMIPLPAAGAVFEGFEWRSDRIENGFRIRISHNHDRH